MGRDDCGKAKKARRGQFIWDWHHSYPSVADGWRFLASSRDPQPERSI